MPEAPPTAEGYFVLHDFRRIDWDTWRSTPAQRREAGIDSGRSYLQDRETLEEGETAVFTIAGHKADLLLLHLRPTLDGVEQAERAFEATAFAEYTEQSTSFVSVTEIGGYTSPAYFEDPESVDPGVRRYMETKRYPEVPEDVYVSFYPMSKRRAPDANWYALPFEERAEMMREHGETGKDYAGTVSQVVSSALGLDDWEWGVTLFATEATALKDIVYDMRFDEATATYGEFGSFYVGRRIPPSDLEPYMAGEAVPTTDAAQAPEHGSDEVGESGHSDPVTGVEPGQGAADQASGSQPQSADRAAEADRTAEDEEGAAVREALEETGVYGGTPHGEDVYALALYSEAPPDDLAAEVDGLRSNFEHYDTHVKTAVYEDRDGGPAAVVSIWETRSAAETASGFLSELPDVIGRTAGVDDGWETMGLFYRVKPEHRRDFVEAFESVEEALQEQMGHRETSLLVNREDENDMFIASRWDSREDAMAFFRSDAFAETVSWGRDVLEDRPRHVFLA